MIKILDDDGRLRNNIYFKQCTRCHTKFTYQYEDTGCDILDFFNNDGDRHVVCPLCRSREYANFVQYEPEMEKGDE